MVKRPKLLLVDDDPDLLDVYREILAGLSSGPEIQTATSGARAISLLESEPFTLLLCDLGMPKMDGLQVLAIVRRRYPELLTVVMITKMDEQYRTRAYGMGVDLFLEKPDTPEGTKLFLDCIESLLNRDVQTGVFRGMQRKSLVDILQPESLEVPDEPHAEADPSKAVAEKQLEPPLDAPCISAQRRGSFPDQEGAARDPVDCTVYAPEEVQAGTNALVQVYAHIPDHADEARVLAEEFDSDTRRRGFTSLGTEIRRGSTLTFEFAMPGVPVQFPVQRMVWRGRTDYVQFDAAIPSEGLRGSLLGRILVSQDNVPIGSILFKLMVTDVSSRKPARTQPNGTATRYTLAFISYAAKDRTEVLRRVQMLTAVGIRYFQDVLDLDPGDHWAQQLFRHIDESDVMFLFWSTAAKESEWVRKEWQYGLVKKGDDFIRPIVIEGPPPPEPPVELRHLHFADKVLYFMS